MSKAKQPIETVIEESAVIRARPEPSYASLPARIPTEWHLPEQPSWDRARALVEMVRRSVNAVIELGMEIHALREEYFAQGARQDLLGRTRISANVEKGWNQAVHDELGIHYSTAYRIMERAQSLVCMRQVEEGMIVEYQDSTSKEMRRLEPSPELQAQATQAIEAVVAGTVAAPRAWAGLVGEATRRTKQGGSAARAAVDHAANIARAITALRNSLKSWKHLDPDDRAELEKQWQGVLAVLPDTMRP